MFFSLHVGGGRGGVGREMRWDPLIKDDEISTFISPSGGRIVGLGREKTLFCPNHNLFGRERPWISHFLGLLC